MRERYPTRNAEIRRRRAAGERRADLAKEFGVPPYTISYICTPREKKLRYGERGAAMASKNRADGLCKCGNSTMPGKAMCERCYDRHNNYRVKWTIEGRCPRCGTDDEMAIQAGNEAMCLRCVESVRAYNEKNAARRRKIAADRKAAGSCPNCGRPRVPNRASCESCLESARRYKRMKKKRAATAGLASVATATVAPFPTLERKAPAPKTYPRKMACLTCGRHFQSAGPGNRMCKSCVHSPPVT